ncbi:MAG TPA: Fe-S protein assembly co-chaperone HscB [Candidatus Binatus sp.]|jgi:molecular chaperone HscB|uniref:Fe-S protein assembly co-chaperone HscB n=1 Tax=Candidatus Binatus sp. TaxID=2811406 RepID=UPI002F421DA8
MIECLSCGRRQEPSLLCAECGTPLAAPLDCFSALGMPRKLTIDLDALERRYHELSRKIHPDRFASKGPTVRDASLRATATLTRSYRTLRDPVARGLYWLELNGEKLAENNKRVPPELAELVFDVQEQLAEMQLSADPEAALERATEIAARRIELQFKMDERLAELDRTFWKWDQPADVKALTLELKMILSNIAYLRTLIRDVDRALENSKAA